MGRKNLLKGLMDQAGTGSAAPKSDETLVSEPKAAPAPRYSKGAIGAVSKQIEELKSRSVIELDPFAIKAAGMMDRLEHDEPDHQTLMHSLQTYGQQVPVLVRPDPEDDGQYLIVYGRRRVLALRDLGLPVKAMVRDLDEAEAIMAQGQENSARRDLSFVERVNFARQMEAAGYDRKIIADALSTDKTLVSRMLKVADALPVDLIEKIGAAHGIGRERWTRFAQLWIDREVALDEALDMLAVHPGQGSDARFETLIKWLEGLGGHSTAQKRASSRKPPAMPLTGPKGKYGRIVKSGDNLVIEVSARKSGGFDQWLIENIDSIHQDWLDRRDGE